MTVYKAKLCAPGLFIEGRELPLFLTFNFGINMPFYWVILPCLLVYYVTGFDNDASLLDVLHISHLRDVCL